MNVEEWEQVAFLERRLADAARAYELYCPDEPVRHRRVAVSATGNRLVVANPSEVRDPDVATVGEALNAGRGVHLPFELTRWHTAVQQGMSHLRAPQSTISKLQHVRYDVDRLGDTLSAGSATALEAERASRVADVRVNEIDALIRQRLPRDMFELWVHVTAPWWEHTPLVTDSGPAGEVAVTMDQWVQALTPLLQGTSLHGALAYVEQRGGDVDVVRRLLHRLRERWDRDDNETVICVLRAEGDAQEGVLQMLRVLTRLSPGRSESDSGSHVVVAVPMLLAHALTGPGSPVGSELEWDTWFRVPEGVDIVELVTALHDSSLTPPFDGDFHRTVSALRRPAAVA